MLLQEVDIQSELNLLHWSMYCCSHRFCYCPISNKPKGRSNHTRRLSYHSCLWGDVATAQDSAAPLTVVASFPMKVWGNDLRESAQPYCSASSVVKVEMINDLIVILPSE